MRALVERYNSWRRRTVPSDTHAADRWDVAEAVPPVVNNALAMAEFAAGVVKVNSTPMQLSLETTSRCNLRCVMCDHAYGKVDRPKHLDEKFSKKIESFVSRATLIQLHGLGEPTNSPAFWRILQRLPPPEICTSSINTNFTVIDEQRLTKLLDSNLAHINVSLDAGTAETYQKIRGFSFEVVTGNIARLLARRRERGQRYPLVDMNMTLMRSNIDEIGDFILLAHRLGADGIQLWHLDHWSDEDMEGFVFAKSGWTFNYAQEGLWNYPALSNCRIREAIDLAKELGITLRLNPKVEIFFDEEA